MTIPLLNCILGLFILLRPSCDREFPRFCHTHKSMIELAVYKTLKTRNEHQTRNRRYTNARMLPELDNTFSMLR